MKSKKGNIAIVAGGYDPFHIGHLSLIKKAREIVGEEGQVISFVARDKHLIKKKGFSFMPEEQRLEIVKNLKQIDYAEFNIKDDGSIIDNLIKWSMITEDMGKELIYVIGGDRFKDEIPEKNICNKLDIEILDRTVGILESSTNLVNEVYNKIKKMRR